jgi:uncharacterized OB-fold protein
MNELPGVELTLYPEDLPFFDALDQGEIAVPWCTRCDDHVWPPRSHCVRCLHPVTERRTLPGAGEIYSYSVVHRGEGPFAGHTPFVVALVSLDGGPTIVANVLADDVDELAVGRRVSLVPRPAPERGRSGAQFSLE